MFRSIVVALDLGTDGDRALPVARALATAGDLPVELLTVSSPHLDEATDAYELSRRAAANGWGPNAFTIAHDNDVGRAIVDHVDHRDRSLLVMATSARPSLAARFFGSVTEAVLSRIDQPVLLVGPQVPNDCALVAPRLVVVVDTGDLAETTVPAVTSWARTFGASRPVLVEVTDSLPDQPGDGPLDRYATLLGAEDINASALRLHDDELTTWLVHTPDHVTDAVFVAASVRWTEPHARGRSMTHRLVRESTRPVLVVPARYAPWRPQSTRPAPAEAIPIDSIEQLTAGECWNLLRSTRVGRLAVCMSGRPGIFPVNFVVDDETIVFRTAAGTKLSALTNHRVAFEIDEYDADRGHATSVIVEGRAVELTEDGDRDRALGLPLFPWHAAPKGHFVRITPDKVSGRRFHAVYA